MADVRQNPSDDAPTLKTKKMERPASGTSLTPGKGGTGTGLSMPSAATDVQERKGMGLGTKFFLAAATLLLVTLGGAVAFATWRANQIAERKIKEDLAQIPGMYEVWRSNREAQLRATVRGLADDTGTREIFGSLPDVRTEEGREEYLLLTQTEDGRNRLNTVHEYLTTKGKLLKSRALLLFDPAGALIARSDKAPGDDFMRPFVYEGERAAQSVKWVAEPVQKWIDSGSIIREKAILSMVASSPVLAGEKAEVSFLGVLAAFFDLDEEQARVLQGITGGQAGFIANTAKKGEPPKAEIAAATATLGGEGFVSMLSANAAAMGDLFGGKAIGPVDVVVAGDRRLVAAVPIKKSGSDEVLGAFVVSRSRDEETAAFREIRNALLLVGVLSLIVAIPVSLAMGRRIARPLEDLAKGAVAIREGNLDVELPQGGRDEVGALARSFKAMVVELREKRQLEELLAEMHRRPEEVSPTATTQALPQASELGEGPVPGRLFANRYEVMAQIGKGGMGKVYRVLDRELDDEVALKVLVPEEFEEGTQAIATLKQEIRLARKITHQNVVRTHDLGESGGIRFLTMEYVPGTTLRELMDKKGAVALAPGLQIAKQLCRGLAAVHEAGIIHRDMKPHNAMVLPNGVVKLMDFGIARTAEGRDTSAPEGQTVGTPYYMSPEQAQAKPLDARSDLYSLGVMLFELFTGRRPYEAPTAYEVMKAHVAAEVPRPSKLRTDLPELVDRIIVACMAKSPEKRPPSAGDLLGALMRIQA